MNEINERRILKQFGWVLFFCLSLAVCASRRRATANRGPFPPAHNHLPPGQHLTTCLSLKLP